MIEKQLKVHASPKPESPSSKLQDDDRFAAFFPTPDMATLISNQRQAVEAVTAATEKLLDGAGEITRKQLMLQNSLMQQAFRNALGMFKPNGGTDETAEPAAASTEDTFNLMRDIATTALRCNADALTAFSDRIRRMEPAVERGRRSEAAD